MTQNALALVTGASGNLGGAVTARISQSGMAVARVERSRVRLGERTVSDIDLSDAASVQRAFALLTANGQSLSAVVHTVGTFRATGPLEAAKDSDFIELFQINVLTTLHVLQAAVRIMRPQGHGRIALVASTDAQLGRAELSAYGASKGAQLRVFESAARELEGSGVALNAVLPGTMDTPQNRAAMPEADPSRWVTLAEVAEVLAFLVSDAASGLHGQALRVERS
jgi:NAD(P)-dependent dehydrogenase (short-subunit alcohol dehydrogenase family)